MKVKKRSNDVEVEIAITPMIDCVFLLLIFFMVSTTLNKQEAEISFSLPGIADQSESVDIPDEQIIEIDSLGRVFLNELEFDDSKSQDLPELIQMLRRFKDTTDANKTEAMVTIAPANDVKHQRVVDVLNACGLAKLKNVTFAVEED